MNCSHLRTAGFLWLPPRRTALAAFTFDGFQGSWVCVRAWNAVIEAVLRASNAREPLPRKRRGLLVYVLMLHLDDH